MNRRSFFRALCGAAVAPVAAMVVVSQRDSSSVFGLSATDTTAFGCRLFQIARDTKMPFTEARDAAVVFARQGLGTEETLRRTQDAMILSRLSGLDTTESADQLTRAIKDFSSESLISMKQTRSGGVLCRQSLLS